MKRFVSILIVVCMTLSLFPAQVFATGQETIFQQIANLPIIAEGEEAPPAQGNVNAPHFFGLVDAQVGVFYTYEGYTEFRYDGKATILDSASRDPVTTAPESNGILQLVNSEGTVVASSNAVSSYSQDYENGAFGAYYVQNAWFYSNDIQNLRLLPDGTYTLQLYAGNTVYPCTGGVVVVDSSCLLIESAYIRELYSGIENINVTLNLRGFQTEEELKKLTLTLTDEDGTVVASSAGQFKDVKVNTYNGVVQWSLQSLMTVADGQRIENNASYSLQVGYTGEKNLYDGVGAVTSTGRVPNLSITGCSILDAQTSRIQLSFSNWNSSAVYTVRVREGYNSTDPVVGSYEGTIPASGTLELSLTDGGAAAPMTSFASMLYIEVYIGSTYEASMTFENPYYSPNVGVSNLWISPMMIASKTGSCTICISGNGIISLQSEFYK